MSSTALGDISKLLSGSVLAKLFGVAALILFTRYLTKQEMAVFPAYLMLAGLCDLILTFGIFSQVLREIPTLCHEAPLKARSLAVTSSALILVGTILPAIAAFFFRQEIADLVFRDPGQGWVIAMIAPAFIGYVVSRITDFLMWGRGQFGATAVVQIAESVIRPICTISMFFIWGFPGIVMGLVVSQFILAAIGFYYVRDLFLGALPPLYPIGKLIRESMPYYLGNYLSYLRTDGDVVVVTSFMGPASLAEYYVAKTLYTNVSVILTTVDKVAVERLARFRHNEQFTAKVEELHIQISQLIVPMMMLIIAVAQPAMTVLAGARYGNATWPAVILLVSALIQFLSIPVDRSVFLQVPGSLRVVYAVVESTAVVLTAFALVPLLGLVGVGAARVMATALTMGFGLWLLKKKHNFLLSPGPPILSILAALPGTAIALVAAPRAMDPVGAFAIAAIITAGWLLIFLILSYLFNRAALDKLWGLFRYGVSRALSRKF